MIRRLVAKMADYAFGSNPPYALVLLALLFSTMPAMAEQFTIRCEGNGTYYFLTFDTTTDRMISETIGGGTYRGQIKGSSETEVRFVMLVDGPTHPDLLLMRKDSNPDLSTHR